MARAAGVPVTSDLAELEGAGIDLGVVVAYGRIIPAALLEVVPMVNVHYSLLPRWRGAAPVERALLAGDAVTGVCLMAVEAGLDTGPVYDRCEVPIEDDDDLGSLRDRLTARGTERLLGLLEPVRTGGLAALPEPVPQEGEPTYAEKLDPAELHLDFSLPAETVWRTTRLGRAWTTFRGRRLVVRSAEVARADGDPGAPPGTLVGTTVACGRGALRLRHLQAEGRQPVRAEDWARGARPAPGERLG